MLPNIVFHTRVYDESSDTYSWKDMTTEDYFANKKVIVFSLPGAFTPTCDTYQLPHFEMMYKLFAEEHGVDEIYCISVNDAFVMNAWAKNQNLKNVKVIPDGSGLFTKEMGMLVKKDNLGFGLRSWRYAMIVDNGNIISVFVEEGKEDNHAEDPYEYTKPQYIMEWMNAHKA